MTKMRHERYAPRLTLAQLLVGADVGVLCRARQDRVGDPVASE